MAEQHSQGPTPNHEGYVYPSPQMECVVLTTQMQGMSLEQESNITPDHALFLWMEEEEIVFANDTLISKTSQVQSDYKNTQRGDLLENQLFRI